MAITYQVNGGTIDGGIVAKWEPIQTHLTSNGLPKYHSDWYSHTWEIALMPETDYQTLKALRGTSLTSIRTSGQDALNGQSTYTNAKCLTVSGLQQGIQRQNVTVTFLISTAF